MPYTSIEQLTERFGERMLLQLTDRASPPAGAIDADVVARALSDTDAVIDGYLAGRYALPLASTPALLADLAQAIAIYKLHPAAPDPKIERDYGDAVKALEKIATGTIRLGVAGVEPTSAGSAGVEVVDRERPLTPENLSGFI